MRAGFSGHDIFELLPGRVLTYERGEVKTGDLGGSSTTDQFTDALCKLVS